MTNHPPVAHPNCRCTTCAQPTLDDVRDMIRRRAGVQNRRVPVRVVDHDRMPPTIRRPKKRRGQPKFKEVVVSAQWLAQKLPKAWASITIARLLDSPDQIRITDLK